MAKPRASRLPEVPVNDYDLSSLQKIKVRDFTYFVMPRYLEHYTAHDYEPFSADLWQRYIQPGDTIVDIGAHFGFYSLLAARATGTDGAVIALEPVPENAEVLAKNAAANGLQGRVDVRHAAASNSDGNHTFNVPWASDSAGFYEHPNAATVRKIDVKTVSLDTLAAKQKVSLLKIDTEGHEIAVLEGGKQFLAANPQLRMLIEFNPDCLFAAGHEPVDLLETIQNLGFAVYIVDENQRRLDRVSGRIQDWEKLMAGREYANLLCLPQASSVDMLVLSHMSQISGGAEMVLAEQLAELQQRNVVSHVIVPAEGTLTERLRRHAISYQVVPMYWWAHDKSIAPQDLQNQDYVNTRATEALYKITMERRPDIVQTVTLAVPWAAAAAAAAKVPHMWSVHEFGDKDHNFIFDYSYRHVLQTIEVLSQRIVVNSQAVRSHLAQVIPASKMTVVYPRVVAVGQGNAPRKQVFKHKGALKIVFLGRILEAKGQLEAVQAAVLLAKKGVTDFELRFVGRVQDKAYLKQMKDLIKESGLNDRVHIDNFTLHPQNYFTQADVFLVCSRNEAFGRVTAEGLAHGKLVIATNSGATPELIEDGKTGFLYTPGDAEALAKHLAYAVGHPDKAKAIAAAGQERLNTIMSPTQTTGKLHKLLLDLRDNPQPAEPFLLDKLVPRFIQIIDDQQAQLHEAAKRHAQEVAELQGGLDQLRRSLDRELQRFHTLRKIAHHPVVRAVRGKK